MDVLLVVFMIVFFVWVFYLMWRNTKSKKVDWVHTFYLFLRKEGAFEKFQEQCIEDFEIQWTHYSTYILHGSDWYAKGDTSYWTELDRKWQQRIEEIESSD